MAVLGRLLVSSSERLDLPDLLSLDSYTAGDFKFLIQGMVGNDRPYILKGFDVINPSAAIGTASVSIDIAQAVVFYPGSDAGSFFFGLESTNPLAQPLVPTLRPNATNFIYLTLTTIDTASDLRAFWDPDINGGDGGEFNQNVNTETALVPEVNVSVATFPDNTIPICKVVMGPTTIQSIEDCRDMLFRLGSGGINPNPFNRYDFRPLPDASYERVEPSITTSSNVGANPFQGADKNIYTLKEWMDVVMTKLIELGGTTFWYESSGTFSLINIFTDALASTLKSKGQWLNDQTTEGLITWTEDLILKNLDDPRDIIVRAGNKTLANEQVMFLNLVREQPINGSNIQVTWTNGANYINGSLGSFINMAQGDYIKKLAEPDSAYLRVEQFYVGANLSGGVTSPALAQSVKLISTYTGASETKPAVYTQGVYPTSDVQVDDRGAAAVVAAGGNFHWLAFRSDLIMNIASATTTTVTGTISDANGSTAKFASVGHGLIDGDSVTISGSVNGYDGTYKVEIKDANTFYINTAVTTGEVGVNAYYATIVTTTRSTADGLLLESANNNFQTGYDIQIAGTAIYDGSFTISARTATSFTIPVASGLAVVNTGTATLVKIDVRTEEGVERLVRGESIGIGDSTTLAIFNFIGMESETQVSPPYFYPPSYNAIYAYHNYNASDADNLTTRVSKLTGMMADRVQDRDLKMIGRVTLRNTTSGPNQVISASGTMAIEKPGSSQQTVTLTSTLPVMSAAIATIDRNGSGAISTSIVSLGTAFLLGENNLVLFYRFNDSNVYTWDANPIPANGTYTTNNYEISQNRNVTAINPGNIYFDAITGHITFVSAGANVLFEVPGSSVVNEIDVDAINTLGTFNIPDGSSAWVRINRVTSKTFNVIQTSDVPDTNANGAIYITTTATVPVDQDVIVFLMREGLNIYETNTAVPPPANIYDEILDISSTIIAGTNIQIPLDSRGDNLQKMYVVGSGMLQVFLNGQYLELGNDWLEVGVIGTLTDLIQINRDLVDGDSVEFRIDSAGGVFIATAFSGVSFPLLAPDGSTLVPQYSFSNSPQTGIYSSGFNNIDVSINNTHLLNMSANTVTLYGATTNLLWNTDGGGNIGALGANRPDIGYFKTLVKVGDSVSINPTDIQFSQQAVTPSNPPALSNKLYFKSDGNVYKLNSSGVESPISGAASVAIGSAISGGTANYALFVDASGNLGQSADFQYNDTTNVLTLAGNMSMSGSANTRHMVWTTDGGGNIGVDTRSTSGLADGIRPRNIFVQTHVTAGNFMGANAPYGINHTLLPGLMFAGNIADVGCSMGTSTLYTGGSTGGFMFHKNGSLVGSVGFANFAVAADLDIYYCKLTAPGPRVDYLKFGSLGTITFMQSSGANLLWNTDGGGNVGTLGANRPDGGYFKTIVKVGDSVTIHPTDIQFEEQASAPSNPPASNMKLYFKTDEKLYMLNSTGTETEVGTALNIGDTVVGGDPDTILFTDASGNLDFDTRFKFDAALGSLVLSDGFFAQDFDVKHVDGDVDGNVGAIRFFGGDGNPAGTGNGGNIELTAGDGGTTAGDGGDIVATPGSTTTGQTGAIQLDGRTRIKMDTTASVATTIAPNTLYYGNSAIGAAKSIALRSIADMGEGTYVIIKDEGGDADLFPITITADGADTFDGGFTLVTISEPYGFIALVASAVGVWRQVGGGSPAIPVNEWTKYTFSYTDLSDASNVFSFPIYTTPGNSVISGVIIKHSQEFTGGTISGYTVEIGIAGNTDKYASAFDVFQTASDSAIQASIELTPEDTWTAGGEAVLITATSIGDTLDQATQGTVDVWIRKEIVP